MRIYFLTPDRCTLADRDPTLINDIRKSLLARSGIEESATPGDADAIVLNELWSFKEWRYIETLLADPVASKYPHKVYTINLDDAATGLLRGIYACLPHSRMQRALHRTVPFPKPPNEFVLAGPEGLRPAPSYLATWRGNPKSNHALRYGLLSLYADSPLTKMETTDSWLNHAPGEKRHYVDLLLAGHFSLCPAGWAPATFRIYESMALGVPPVLIADEFVPPQGPDWDRCSVRVAEKDLPRLEQTLQAHLPKAADLGGEARKAWLRYFSPEHMMSYYADALLSCIQARSASDSAEKEVARWRSWQMYWTNRWTLPQRVKVKVRNLFFARPVP
ncbi:exostosin family protein [Variovorax humicola]|uniref:Exostosin family protein n=1 Tax=Variovorax humicola TaxID=1769758 RepID=A0ABU8VRW7_9BURK